MAHPPANARRKLTTRLFPSPHQNASSPEEAFPLSPPTFIITRLCLVGDILRIMKRVRALRKICDEAITHHGFGMSEWISVGFCAQHRRNIRLTTQVPSNSQQMTQIRLCFRNIEEIFTVTTSGLI